MKKVGHFLTDDRGATAIEYCLIACAVAVVIVISLGTIGTKINHYFLQIAAVN